WPRMAASSGRLEASATTPSPARAFGAVAWFGCRRTCRSNGSSDQTGTRFLGACTRGTALFGTDQGSVFAKDLHARILRELVRPRAVGDRAAGRHFDADVVIRAQRNPGEVSR